MTAFGPAWDDPRIRAGTAEMLVRRELAIAAGERSLGWKLAFGAPGARDRLGLPGPAVGYLTAATQRPSGSTIACGDWVQPAFEAELAIYLGRDVEADEEADAAAGAISAIGPAIELADVDRPAEDLVQVLAGDIYHRAVILGDGTRSGRDAGGLSVRVTRDGVVCVSEPDPESVLGRPGEIVAYVVRYLGAFGSSLRAGEIIISGSVMPFLTVAAGERLEYELAPLATVSVTLVEGGPLV